jgi:hypothetical protein
VAVVVALVALAACGGDEEGAPEATTGTASAARFEAEGCPVDDAEFCERAASAANALVAGDTARVVELSYADSFPCDDLPPELFPDCSSGRTLEGHALTGADGKITILPPAEYEARLAELTGSAEVAVTGIGTCGPDDPARRSYHLGYWAVQPAETGSEEKRWGGSLEFVLREGEWSNGLDFADSIQGWKRQYDDPETELACGNVQAWSRPPP